MSSTTEQAGRWPAEEILTDELAQPDLWESEQEYQDFLADLYASRQTDEGLQILLAQ